MVTHAQDDIRHLCFTNLNTRTFGIVAPPLGFVKTENFEFGNLGLDLSLTFWVCKCGFGFVNCTRRRRDTRSRELKLAETMYTNDTSTVGIFKLSKTRPAEKVMQRIVRNNAVLFQISYTTSVVVRMVGIDGMALARDYSLRTVLG